MSRRAVAKNLSGQWNTCYTPPLIGIVHTIVSLKLCSLCGPLGARNDRAKSGQYGMLARPCPLLGQAPRRCAASRGGRFHFGLPAGALGFGLAAADFARLGSMGSATTILWPAACQASMPSGNQ